MKLELYSTGLETDSSSYDVLERAVQKAPQGGLYLEIGTRRGGSTKVMIDALARQQLQEFPTLICLDPWGNIEYAERQGVKRRLDYTNSMRDDTLKNLYAYVHHKPVSLHVLTLEDTEYFERFKDGFPVYDQNKKFFKNYSCVFFDGPHDVETLMIEIGFFNQRKLPGTIWVFDDIQGYYPHDEQIEPLLFKLGFELLEKKTPKASYKCL